MAIKVGGAPVAKRTKKMKRTAVKICGISTQEAQKASIAAGADFLGFVFFPKSPRAVTPEIAGSLCQAVPPSVRRVALVVDPDDALLESILQKAEIDLFQLHGREDIRRVAQIKKITGKGVIKVAKVADANDIFVFRPFEEVADWLLFDAKAPESLSSALPGGNALSFDWQLLDKSQWKKPWMLAGGLTPENVALAIERTGPTAVDVSSGVESAPGKKSSEKIKSFITAAKGL